MGQTRVHTPVMREETREALGHQKYQKHKESDTDQPWANQKPFSASIVIDKQWLSDLPITKCAFTEPLASLQYILGIKVK